jgi:uncharacterized protein
VIRPWLRPRRLIALGAFVLLMSAYGGAEPLTSIANPRTRDGTWVTDTPGILRADTIAGLNAAIGDFERTNGAEMAVVVIRSLDGLSIEEAAVKLFELWKIGKANKDNGLLLLWSTGDRRVRVEVGYGLEGVLPDSKVGRILDTYVIPKFKSGEFDEGLRDGVDALLRAAREEPVELPSAGSQSSDPGPRGVIVAVVSLLAGIPLAVGSIIGVWKFRRRHPRRCPTCRTWMTRLSESADNALLEEGQQAEERIKSVDYDVWRCRGCGHHFTLRYPKWISRYERCPQCRNRTKSSTEKVIDAASTTSSGSALVVETCAFCTFRREHTKVLPRIEPSSSSSAGSSSGSSGGGSSSFGGGSSGGGGASRGY